jgi:hypothetical protein
MAAKTITFAASGYLQGKIEVNSVANGSTENTSTVTARIYARRTSGYTTGKSWNGNVNIGGNNHTYGTIHTNTSTTIRTSWVLIQTYSNTITHNDDGKKTITVSGSVSGPSGTSLEGVTSRGSDSNVTLDDIARQANITSSSNFNDEENPVIGYSNPAGNSVTSLDIAIYNTGGTVAYAGYRAVNKTGTSYTFNLTNGERNALRAAMPNATSMTVRFYLRTVISGVTYYSTVDKTVSITNAAPTVLASYADLNTVVSAVTGSNQTLVSGLSNARVTAVPITNKYSTVASLKIGGVTVAAPYQKTFNNVDVATVDIKVTDSRGYTATTQVTFTYTEYEGITFLASFFRTAAANNEVALQFSGTFFNDYIGETANAISVRYRYQPELGEWSEWIEVNVVTDGNEFSNEGVQVSLGSIFSRNSQYRFEIEFIDSLDIKTNTIIVRTARTVLKVTENCQVLQGKLHIQKLYTKNDKDFVFDFVYDIITRTWLVHVYGLTQMFEPQHIFQADVNARSIITVLNKEGYPLLKYTLDDTSDNFIDYINVDEQAIYNNFTMVDTGICPLQDMLEKRARELQFTTYNTGVDKLEFFVSAYIDSRNVSNPDETFIDWITDPEDPDYGKLYAVEEEVANVYGETNLDSWVIDQSRFPKIGLIKSHLNLHGKGLYYRAIIINRDMVEHELSGIAWIYRVMNAR